MPNKPCTHTELIARVVALESNLAALRQVLDERDERYKLRASNQDDAVRAALETSDKALLKAEAATEKRFDNVNEFRQTLADQANTLMPRAEYNAKHEALAERVQKNEDRANLMQRDLSNILARGGGLKEGWGYLVAVAGLALAIVSIYFHR